MEPGYEIRLVTEHAAGAFQDAIRAAWPEEWSGFLAGRGHELAHTYRVPGWRVLAEDPTGAFAGQLALVPLTEGVLGIADWFTVTAHRGWGVARALGAAVVAWADAERVTLVVDTGDPGLRRVCARHGFAPVTRLEEVALETAHGAVLLPNLMVRGLLAGLVLSEKF